MLQVMRYNRTAMTGSEQKSLFAQRRSWRSRGLLLSAIFGAGHLHNREENMAAIVVAAGFGILIAYSFRRSGSLWFGLGLHAGWDFAETFIFGVPDSGIILPGSLLKPEVHGPPWITGGSAGPEGSYLMIPLLLGMLWVVRTALVPEASWGPLSGSPDGRQRAAV